MLIHAPFLISRSGFRRFLAALDGLDSGSTRIARLQGVEARASTLQIERGVLELPLLSLSVSVVAMRGYFAFDQIPISDQSLDKIGAWVRCCIG